jgi:hypothetical protein
MDYISGLAKWLSLATMPSATKMARFFSPLREQVAGAREESARQKSGSRNQDPANPIPQNRGCHNIDDPFDDEAYRKHQEEFNSV